MSELRAEQVVTNRHCSEQTYSSKHLPVDDTSLAQSHGCGWTQSINTSQQPMDLVSMRCPIGTPSHRCMILCTEHLLADRLLMNSGKSNLCNTGRFTCKFVCACVYSVQLPLSQSFIMASDNEAVQKECRINYNLCCVYLNQVGGVFGNQRELIRWSSGLTKKDRLLVLD